MPLAAIDLLTPRGRLNGAALWPGVPAADVNTKLDAFLTEAYAKAEVAALDVGERDEPAKLWAYYRAWDEVYQRMLALPSTVATSDQGSASYLQLQLTEFGTLADQALAEFTELIAEAKGTVVGYPVITSLR